MDPVTAIGLSVNVIDLTKLFWKTADSCIACYKDGTEPQFEETRAAAQDLKECTTKLHNASNSAMILQSDVDLQSICRHCCVHAKELGDEIEKLKVVPGTLNALIMGLKIHLKKKHVEELKKKMDEQVMVLHTKVLVHLSQNMGTVSVHLKDLLVRLDQQQQGLLKDLGDRHDALDKAIRMSNTTTRKLLEGILQDLKDDNAAQHIVTRSHDTAEHDETRSSMKNYVDHAAQESQQRRALEAFKNSLHFPGIESRQDSIESHHQKTCEWIFAGSYDDNLPWDNFLAWLRDDQPVYWVFGKPGSGKSTLMNFLVQDERIKTTLTGSGGPVVILKFFFWELGDELQKNRAGLLRSLLWQFFTEIGEPAAVQLLGQVQGVVSNNRLEWTQKRLLLILGLVLSRTHYRLCVFLDGLDEFQDVEDDLSFLVEVIDIFRGVQSVKICISSRPSPILNDKFKDCPKLRLQDFTKRDITAYVQDNLIEHITKRFSIGRDSEKAILLVDTVVDKAEGVFLWVCLAVKSLLRGIGKNDRVDDLERRLEQIPRGLSQLYSHMWKRVEADDAIYAAEAATYLQFILHFGSDSMSLLKLAIASDKDLQDACLISGCEQPEFLHNLGQGLDSDRVEKRLTACCAGFLEVRAWDDRDEESLNLESSNRAFSKEESLDGESSNGEFSNEESLNEEPPNEEPPNEEPPNEEPPNEEPPNEEPPNEEPPNEEPPNEEPPNEEPPNEEPPNEEPPNEEPPNEEPPNEEPPNEEPPNEEPPNEEPPNEEPPNKGFLGVQENSPLVKSPHLLERLGALRAIHKRTRVSLIHKSAREYFRQGDGKAFLDRHPLCKQDIRKRALSAVKVLLLLLVIPSTPGAVIQAVKDAEIIDLLLYLDSQSAVTVLSDLERVCEVIRSLHLVDSARWPRMEDSEAVDYALAFMDLNVPEYTSLKLNQPGTARSQYNLDECLCQAIFSLSVLRGGDANTPLLKRDTNIEVLLLFRADPNAKTHMAFAGVTLWLTFLVMLPNFRAVKGERLIRLLEAFMCAGADPNASCDLRLTVSTRLFPLSPFSMWRQLRSNDNLQDDDDIMYLRWAVCEVLTNSDIENEVLEMMRTHGTNPARAKIVMYHAPSSWFVLSDEPSVTHGSDLGPEYFVLESNFSGRSSDRFSAPWGSGPTEMFFHFSESRFTHKAGFGNHGEALRFAGWPEESIERICAYEDSPSSPGTLVSAARRMPRRQ